MNYAIIFVVISVFSFFMFRPETESGRIDREATEARELAQRTPTVYTKSNDGCTVYTFVANNRNQYFTRCENATTSTITKRVECSFNGKVNVCKNKETVIENQ